MEIKARFDHMNINVTDLDKSINFYREALGLEVVGHIDGPEGAFKIVYLGTEERNFELELTWLAEHPQPYELGENESHLCMRVAGDYEACREFYREMGCLCYENHDMGLYFIEDPDGYWIEILPQKG